MTYDWSIFRLAVFINTGTSAEIPSACLITVFSKEGMEYNQYPMIYIIFVLIQNGPVLSIVNIYRLFVDLHFTFTSRSNANVPELLTVKISFRFFFVTVAYSVVHYWL